MGAIHPDNPSRIAVSRRVGAIVAGGLPLGALLLGAWFLGGAWSLAADADAPTGPAASPKRIITIAPNAAEIICDLGAGDRLVGVSTFCTVDAVRDRPRVGGLFDPNLERILALSPDLIVLRGRSESVQNLCRQRGIALYQDETDSLDGIRKCVRDIGALLHERAAATRLVRNFDARIAEIQARVRDKPKPRVLLTASREPDRIANVLTAGPGTFLHEMIEIGGGINVFGDIEMVYPRVSAEGIVARRPEIIIELMPEVTMTPTLRKRLVAQWDSLASVPAVASGRIYFITEDGAQIPSPRFVEIVDRVSRLLHPVEPRSD